MANDCTTNRIEMFMRVRILFLSVYFLLCIKIYAQQEYRLWQEVPPYAKSFDTVKETSIAGPGFTKMINVTMPSVSVYLPQKPSGTAVLILPGGAYGFLAWDIEGTKVAEWLQQRNIAAVVLKYRLPNDLYMHKKHLVPLTDALRAMQFIRQHASTWQIDTNKIGILGFSAGGHLAASVSTHYDDFNNSSYLVSGKPNFSVLIYPVISSGKLGHPGSMGNLLGKHPSKIIRRYFSLDKQVDEHTPSTLLFHPIADATVPVINSRRYYHALMQKKIDAMLYEFKDGGHGFGVAENNGTGGDYHQWKELMLEWLTKKKFYTPENSKK